MLEKLKKTIDRGIVSAGVQSTTYLETGKLRSKIDNLENAIAQIKIELGQTVYDNWKNGADNTACIKGVGNRIQSLEKEIAGYQAKIQELLAEKERIIAGGVNALATGCLCSCGQRNEQGAKFCICCGKEIASATENNAAFCLNCGTPLTAGARFCTNCGTAQSEEKIQ